MAKKNAHPDKAGAPPAFRQNIITSGPLGVARSAPKRHSSAACIDSGAMTRARYEFSKSVKTAFKFGLLSD